MTLKELKQYLKAELPELEDMGDGKLSTYLGTVQSLDPCGKYHHLLSPNGMEPEDNCERYWSNLESAAESLNAWIENGDGDPCDVYLCMNGGKDNGRI